MPDGSQTGPLLIGDLEGLLYKGDIESLRQKGAIIPLSQIPLCSDGRPAMTFFSVVRRKKFKPYKGNKISIIEMGD